MNRLQMNFYTVYPTVEAPYVPILIDLRWSQAFLENAEFIKLLKSKGKKSYSEMKILQYFDYLEISKKKNRPLRSSKSLQKLQECLPLIHRQAAPDAQIFWQNPISQDDERLWLATERFFWFFPPHNLGSARHMLLKNLQLKGSGRSPLALRTDFHHTWGGQYFWQSLKAYIVSHLLEGALPQGILSTPLISILQDEFEGKRLEHSSNSLMIREANDLRITQVATGFDQELNPSIHEIQKSILNETHVQNFQELFQKLIFQYASMLLLGLRHTSVTRENIMIKGSLMDYEDIETYNQKTSFDFHFMARAEKPKSKKINQKNIKQILENGRIYTSTFHFYLDAIILSAHGLNFLGAKIPIERSILKKIFMQEIKKLSETIFILDPELLSFIDKTLDLFPGYDRDIQKSRMKPSPIKSLKHKIKLEDAHLVKHEIGISDLTLHLKISFPRIKFRHPLLEAFNLQKKQGSILEITQKIFKIIEIELMDRPPNFDIALDLTSKVHERLSLEQLVFPFEKKSNKTQMKFSELSKVLETFQHQGIKILELMIFRMNKANEFKTEMLTVKEAKKLKKCEFILLGVKTLLPYKRKIHFFTQPGIIIKMK